MKTHKDLIIWQKSVDLAVLAYQHTNKIPKEELCGITSQMRRTSFFIPSNIAEGYRRFSDKELVRFLFISLGSASELETQLILSLQLRFLSDESFNELNDLNNKIVKILVSLIRSKKQRTAN